MHARDLSILLALVVATPAPESLAEPLAVAVVVPRPAEPPRVETTRVEPAPLPAAVVTAHLVFGTRELAVALPLDGKVDGETARALAYFFRDVRRGKQLEMHAAVLALLADVARTWPGRTIEVVSGVRTPPNGAPRSKHFVGRAIDLRVRGVPTTELRDHLWRTHAGRGIGVGWYTHKNFVHMDVRPGQNDCAWTGKREGGKNQYHPRWARRQAGNRQ